MKLLSQELTRRVLIRVSDLWLYQEPLVKPLHTGGFQFLGNPKLYNTQGATSSKVKGNPYDVRPLSRTSIEENKFLQFFMRKVDPHLTSWDRQAPFRLYLPLRIASGIDYQNIKTYTYPPEVLLFPSGWATLLQFSFEGSVRIAELNRMTSQLFTLPMLSVNGKRVHKIKLETLLNYIGKQVTDLLYVKSNISMPDRLLGFGITTILDYEHQDSYRSHAMRNYTTDDWRIMFSNIRPDEGVSIEDVPVLQKACFRANYKGGLAVGQYGKGLFMDLPCSGARAIRCLSHNLQYFVLVTELLQAFINTGVKRLPYKRDVSSQNAKKVFGRLYDLMVTSQNTLSSLSDGYKLSIAQSYLKNHGGVTKALQWDLPTIGAYRGWR